MLPVVHINSHTGASIEAASQLFIFFLSVRFIDNVAIGRDSHLAQNGANCALHATMRSDALATGRISLAAESCSLDLITLGVYSFSPEIRPD